MIKLDILSDPICPWCYIGKTLLDQALSDRPGHPFQIEWHPFQLNPDMPAEGMDRRQYLEWKFGGRDQAVSVYSEIDAHARKVGLELNLGGITRTPNTLNAHRLIHWAGIEGRQQAVVSFLFEAYFLKGQDIGDTDVLVAVAERAEMDGAAVRVLLDGTADADDIRARDAHARARGVRGVPTFIVAQQHVLTGAQKPDIWREVIDELTGGAPEGTPVQ